MRQVTGRGSYTMSNLPNERDTVNSRKTEIRNARMRKMMEGRVPTFSRPSQITIAGIECPIQYTKHGHYIVELFGSRTVVCRNGNDLIELKDSFTMP